MSNVTYRMVEAAWKAYQDAQSVRRTFDWMRPVIEAALREQPAPEPVAWRWKAVIDGDRISNWVLTHSEPPPYAVAHEPLYAHPPQQRKPLTEEEIESIWRQKPRWHAPPIGTTDIEFARAVEQAHGIGDSDE